MLGPVGEGWKVAMATLGFERGTAFLSQQLSFEQELTQVLDLAHKNGAAQDPVLRDELAQRYAGLQVLKYNGMRMLTNLLQKGTLGPEASIGKLFWTTWHRNFGDTAMKVLGTESQWRCLDLLMDVVGQYAYLQDGTAGVDVRLALEQVYRQAPVGTFGGGVNEVQREIIGMTGLGLPRAPR